MALQRRAKTWKDRKKCDSPCFSVAIFFFCIGLGSHSKSRPWPGHHCSIVTRPVEKKMAAEIEKVADFHSAKRRKRETRSFPKLPVWICENHDKVLYYVHRSIASRNLPFEGITLLHFDSHPDLTVPVDLQANVVYDKTALYDKISIADWILPAVYAGHINRVIWVKPQWADQLEDGIYNFKVGRHKENGCLRYVIDHVTQALS